ncbi:4-coumarate-CoA ligase-like protein [Glonium stellatum]|uniref:4-coumarate-CoA ligase-like protein n=1 Tax=Glonium stellatum TaxID=574774 RepID=A0A8E2FCA4_9PEZI|nr:4-coumarate-CoA ligase-like protein [Glonium stellatum]
MPFLAQEHLPVSNKDILSWIFDEQAFDQNQPIYIDAANPSRTICSRQARSMIRKLVGGFKAIGLLLGDCVCLLSFNDAYYSMAFLGIVAAGGIFTGVNPSHTSSELQHAFRIAKVKCLIVEPELLKNALIAAEACNIPRSRIFIFDVHGQSVPENLASWSTLQGHGECDWIRFDDKNTSENTTVARLFSSGTTGLPKALDMSHYNFVAQHTLVMEYKERDYTVIRLLCNPMFHVSIVPRAHTSPLRGGIFTYIMHRFELESYLRNIERYQITEVNMVPPMVVSIINSPLSKKYSLKSLRNAWSGSAPLNRGLQLRLKALMREGAPFNQVWGMSESSCIATMLYYPEQDSTGSVGRFLPGLDAKIVDEDGRDISGLGVAGELCVRGPTVVQGYFENEEANRRDWDEDGYFHTGDVAYCDEKSKLWYIVDRKKELIKVRGFQVAPAELEGALLSHPDVIDVAVIGVTPVPNGSELPRAYIVRRAGTRLTEEQVMVHTRERLANYKRLDGGIRFVESIPKNAGGKILKNVLREQAARERSAKL